MTGLEYLLQQLVNALSVGSLYALIAVGLSLIFGILRLSNFAHGDMMMIGAFATVLLTTSGLTFLPAFVLGIVVAALAGVIIERVAYRPVRGAPDVTMLLTSLALTFILENLGILLFTASPRNFPLPDWMTQLWSLADGRVTFTNINVLSVGLTVISLLFLTWFMRRTTVGLGMRAAAEDLGAAQLVGVQGQPGHRGGVHAGLGLRGTGGRAVGGAGRGGRSADGLYPAAQGLRGRHHRRAGQLAGRGAGRLPAGSAGSPDRGVLAAGSLAVP